MVSPIDKQHEPNTNSTTEIEVSSHLEDWMKAINSHDANALQHSYDTNAVKIISADNIINGASNIAAHYGKHKQKITTIKSLFRVEANKRRGITYEMVKFTTDNQKEYLHIVIWKTKDGNVVREFEFTEIHKTSDSKAATTEITQRRKLWMELCNAHNAENLVKQLYSPNTMYYNHKPIVQGTENLIKEYGYMNNNKYSLKLEPKKLIIANSDVAFEIGQCSGSYGGKYILIWKKQADGNWDIYIDSNI